MGSHSLPERTVLLTAIVFVLAVCALGSSVKDTPSNLAELWQEPSDLEKRNLFYGPGGAELAPDPAGRYELLEVDTKGFSPGYDVRDARRREWSVKLGRSADGRGVALVWAVGYRRRTSITFRGGS
jgi:hypothetical protein